MPEEHITRIDITSRSILRITLIAVGLWFLYIVSDILLLILTALLLAAAIEPLANILQRYHIPRAVTVIVVYIAILLAFSSAVTLIIPPLTAQIVQLAHVLPDVVDAAIRWVPASARIHHDTLVATVQNWLITLGNSLSSGGSIFEQTRNIFSGATTIVF
ncbi:MAG TPA: AI-2E family transporter, partial [Bryobacteraceae bacterium]|nr:AI-2E family transporter [Bryobacteraceae bacterium]